MELTFEAGKNMVLDAIGHISLFELRTEENPTRMVGTTDEKVAKELGVKHLPREWFVRKVDALTALCLMATNSYIVELPQSITITSDFKQKIDTIWK